MKILFYIATHKRHEVLRMCLDNLKELSKKWDIDVFCVSSPQDAQIISEYDYDYCIEDNFPLGRKKNLGLKEAMKKDFTHLIELGSDDIITDELLTEYEKNDSAYFGINNYHLIDLRSGRAKHWTYGIQGQEIYSPIGAGRVFKKETLEDALSKGDLWPDEQQRGLDGASDTNMMLRGYKCDIIPFKGIGIIDLKTDENIWPFDDVDGVEYDFKALSAFVKDTVDEHR